MPACAKFQAGSANSSFFFPSLYPANLNPFAKKRAHKYRAEATSDRIVKATRTVHASHPRETTTTDSALISFGVRDSWRMINHTEDLFASCVVPPPPSAPPATFRLGAAIIAEWLSDPIVIVDDDIVVVTSENGF